MKKGVNPLTKVIITQIVLIFLMMVWLIPAYTMIINGFKSNSEILSSKALVPPISFSTYAFQQAWAGLEQPILNSLSVILPVAIISTVFGSMAAYYFDILSNSFSKRNKFFSDFAFTIVALATFIPYQATLMPL
ncbi:MAG: glucose ABC transporter permease GlcU, partial [Thermoplasmata archaeon]